MAREDLITEAKDVLATVTIVVDRDPEEEETMMQYLHRN